VTKIEGAHGFSPKAVQSFRFIAQLDIILSGVGATATAADLGFTLLG
jgi:hypothetical protein